MSGLSTAVIAKAMQHVLPERAVPQTYKTGIPTIIVGVDPRTGATFTDHSAEVYAGWCNAARGMDAWGAQAAAFGNLVASITVQQIGTTGTATRQMTPPATTGSGAGSRR